MAQPLLKKFSFPACNMGRKEEVDTTLNVVCVGQRPIVGVRLEGGLFCSSDLAKINRWTHIPFFITVAYHPLRT